MAGGVAVIYSLIAKMNPTERRVYDVVLGCLMCPEFRNCQCGQAIVAQPRSLLESDQDEISQVREHVA